MELLPNFIAEHLLEWHEAMARGWREPRGHTLVTQNVSFAREFYQVVGGFDEKLRLDR